MRIRCYGIGQEGGEQISAKCTFNNFCKTRNELYNTMQIYIQNRKKNHLVLIVSNGDVVPQINVECMQNSIKKDKKRKMFLEKPKKRNLGHELKGKRKEKNDKE